MKLINRAAERWAMPLCSVIAEDQCDDKVHVVVCPYSGDVEVWEGERLEFKAYCWQMTSRSTMVGLSGNYRQSKRNKKWAALVYRCKTLQHDKAFSHIYRYAIDVAAAIENRDTNIPRSVSLRDLYRQSEQLKADMAAAGIPIPPLKSARPLGDIYGPDQIRPWEARLLLYAASLL